MTFRSPSSTWCSGYTEVFPRGDLRFDLRKERIGDTAESRMYRFVSPWFALNQDNYRIYQASNPSERVELLNRILIGNLLSFAKGMGMTVESRLTVSTDLHSARTGFKNEHIVVFYGTFSVNYELPSCAGIGKSISRGFGTLQPLRGSGPSPLPSQCIV